MVSGELEGYPGIQNICTPQPHPVPASQALHLQDNPGFHVDTHLGCFLPRSAPPPHAAFQTWCLSPEGGLQASLGFSPISVVPRSLPGGMSCVPSPRTFWEACIDLILDYGAQCHSQMQSGW